MQGSKFDDSALCSLAETAPDRVPVTLPDGSVIGHATNVSKRGNIVEADIHITGTAKTPIAAGELLFKNGYFRQASTGTVLSDIQVYALANSQRIDLVTAFARDGEGGTVKADGYVDWSQPQSANAVNLTLRTKDAHLCYFSV